MTVEVDNKTNCANNDKVESEDDSFHWGAVGVGLLIINAICGLLWCVRGAISDFFSGYLIPVLTLSLLPGSIAAVVFRWRKYLTFYRVGLALGLLIYLFLKKTLEWGRLSALFSQWQFLTGGILLLSVPILLCVWRWQWLLRGQKMRVGYRALLRLTLVGYFFNVFVPGANGGDFYRIYELARKKSVPTAIAATTVLLDHFLGLPMLMICVLVGVVSNYTVLGDGENFARFHYLVKFLGIAAIIVLMSFLGLLIGSLFLHSPVSRIADKIPLGKKMAKITAALNAYREQPSLLVAGIFISLPMHLLTLSAFGLFGMAAEIRGLDCSQYLFLVFAGLSLNYLPISPGGVGVGEVGFETLFQLVPPFLASNGAAAAGMMISYRVAMLLYGLIGWGIYLSGKHQVADTEIDEIP